MHKRVSVIIVTYNSEKHIYDCLSSIYRYNDIGDLLEVIIVDNNSCKNEYEGSTSNDKPSFPLLYHCFIPNKATSLLESK